VDFNQQTAINAYYSKTLRKYVPGEKVLLPTDALVFAEYQQPWKTLEEFKANRCHYDPETNEELIYFVTEALLGNGGFEVPPIYVDILYNGIALVDGAHRTTACLIAEIPYVPAQLNRKS